MLHFLFNPMNQLWINKKVFYWRPWVYQPLKTICLKRKWQVTGFKTKSNSVWRWMRFVFTFIIFSFPFTLTAARTTTTASSCALGNISLRLFILFPSTTVEELSLHSLFFLLLSFLIRMNIITTMATTPLRPAFIEFCWLFHVQFPSQ